MSEPRVFGSSQGTLGDSLWVTPLLRAFPASTLRLFDTPSCRNVSQIYEGLVDHVEFCDAPGVPPTVDLATHVSERMLIAAGRPEASIIPTIRLLEDEIAWARAFLFESVSEARHLDRLIVLHTHNSGWRDPENWFSRHVKPPIGLMQRLADDARRSGYTVLQFCNAAPTDGRPDNFDPLDGTHHIRGLTLRETAACYHLIGRMISGDTGDPYLALAAGAKVIFLMCPELEQTGYRWRNVAYTDRHWATAGERPRTRYYNHSDPATAAAVQRDLSFDW